MTVTIDSSRIRSERLKRAWSQEQLAHVAGLGLRTVNRIEKNGRGSLESLKSLAAVFELLPEDLMGEEDSSESQPRSEHLVLTASSGSTNPALLLVAQLQSVIRSSRRFLTGGIVGAFISSFSFMLADSVAASQVTLDMKGIVQERMEGDWSTFHNIEQNLLLEEGEQTSVEIDGLFRIQLKPSVTREKQFLIEAEVYAWIDEGYVLVSEPSVLTNGKEKMVLSSSSSSQLFELSMVPEIQ